MQVINLITERKNYTSNVYLILSEWKAIDDINAMIDVGRDSSIIDKIKKLNTGVGKKKIDKVILTHGHFDHTSLLPIIKYEFDPKIYAFHSGNGVNYELSDSQLIKLADRWFEVIHVPGHTNDSICLYCPEDHIIFSGDTQLIINSTDNTFHERFVKSFEKIVRKNIKIIYPGHGDPITNSVNHLLHMSLDNIRKSKIIKQQDLIQKNCN